MSQVALELKNINTTVNIGTPEEKRIFYRYRKEFQTQIRNTRRETRAG